MPLRLLCIVGPTAIGKTKLAVRLAEHWHSEIISVDSRQVYRGLDIGTGKDLADYSINGKTVPYHMIDITSPEVAYTVYEYQQAVYHLLEWFLKKDDYAEGKKPIILCGGSGLYLEAVLKGYRIPSVPEDSAFRNSLSEVKLAELDKMLLTTAPHLYQLTDKSSSKRIIRALEVARAGGVLQEENFVPISFEHEILCLQLPREELYARIAKRLDQRLKEGLIEEVEQLASMLSSLRLSQLGMEYREISQYLDGQCSRAQMRENLFREICRLSRRQQTWFKGMPRRALPMRTIESWDENNLLSLL